MTEAKKLLNKRITTYDWGKEHKEVLIPYDDALKAVEEAINYNHSCTELPIKELPNCNRVEVIDQKGRSYVNCQPNNKVRLSIQDDGRTAKVFID